MMMILVYYLYFFFDLSLGGKIKLLHKVVNRVANSASQTFMNGDKKLRISEPVPLAFEAPGISFFLQMNLMKVGPRTTLGKAFIYRIA